MSFKINLIKKRDFTPESADLYEKRIANLMELESGIETGDPKVIERALIKIRDNKAADSTVKGYIAALRQYLQLEQGISWEEKPYPQKAKRKKPLLIIQPTDLDLIRNYLHTEDSDLGIFLSLRNRLFFELQHYTASKLKELLSLTIHSTFQHEENMIVFSNRKLPLPLEIAETAEKYLYFRKNQQIIKKDEALFVNRFHSKISSDGAQDIMRYICQKAGVKNNYTTTNVRETRMLQLFQLGFNEIEIALISGTISFFKIEAVKNYMIAETTDQFETEL